MPRWMIAVSKKRKREAVDAIASLLALGLLFAAAAGVYALFVVPQ
jgi:hypothetical protein